MFLPLKTFAVIALAVVVSCASAREAGVAPSARVRSVQPASVADLVVLDGGFDSGLRQGMVCRVVRAGVEVGELVLVEIRPSHSTAILLNLRPYQSVRPGDLARVKTLKS